MANETENNSKLAEMFTKLSESLNEQQWFQELRAKWEELDPQSRTYLKAAISGVSVLLVLYLVFSSIWSVHSQKAELAEKADLLHTIDDANDELRRLQSQTANASSFAGGETGPWGPYFESTAGTAGIDKSNLAVGPEKANAPGDSYKESLFDLNLKHVNVKQVVRYAYYLENGQRPIKLRNLLIDTKADPSGYMDATLAISAFAPVPVKQ